jgi:hypothetical protein
MVFPVLHTEILWLTPTFIYFQKEGARTIKEKGKPNHSSALLLGQKNNNARGNVWVDNRNKGSAVKAYGFLLWTKE